jgi:hypothetical protein
MNRSNMKRFMTKKVLVVGVAVAVLLGVGGAAFAYYTSNGSGTGSAATGDASPLHVVLGTLTGGPLFPTIVADGNAVVDTVPYTVTNPGEGDVNLNTVVIEVTPGFSYVDGAGDPACTAADFSINGQAVGTPATLTGLNKTLNGLSDAPNNAYTGSFTIEMVENGANQDSCQSGSVPLTVTVNTPAPAANLLSSIAYYTVTPASGTWTRSTTPFASDSPDTQSVGAGGAVTLSITGTGSTPYADNGFYMVLGTLGSLNGYTIQGTGTPFYANLYIGYATPPATDFFNWSSNTWASYGSTLDGQGLATSSGGTLTVTGSSTFTVTSSQTGSCNGGTYTLTALKAGACGALSTMPIALWVGVTNLETPAPVSTTITSVTAS